MDDGVKMSEAQLRAVLSRAIELDAETRTPQWAKADLETIASEVGVSAASVRNALAEVTGQDLSEPSSLRLSSQAEVEPPISATDLARLAKVLNSLGLSSELAQYGPDHFRWVNPEGLRVSVRRVDDEATVIVDGDLRSTVATSTLIVVGGAIAGWASVGFLLPGHEAVAAGLALGGAGALGWWKLRVRQIQAGTSRAALAVADALRGLSTRDPDA